MPKPFDRTFPLKRRRFSGEPDGRFLEEWTLMRHSPGVQLEQVDLLNTTYTMNPTPPLRTYRGFCPLWIPLKRVQLSVQFLEDLDGFGTHSKLQQLTLSNGKAAMNCLPNKTLEVIVVCLNTARVLVVTHLQF